jgi:hypothetical protein
MTRTIAFVAAAVVLWGCSGDPSGPSQDVAGTYTLTEFTFDPQGSIPEEDLLPRLDVDDVRLVLAPGGQAQLRYVNPATGLLTVVNATYSTPTDGVRVHFEVGPDLRTVLLPSQLTFAYASETGTIRFDDAAPGGLDRQRLLELVPEWADEQLLSPVPGHLVVEFTRVSAALGAS